MLQLLVMILFDKQQVRVAMLELLVQNLLVKQMVKISMIQLVVHILFVKQMMNDFGYFEFLVCVLCSTVDP